MQEKGGKKGKKKRGKKEVLKNNSKHENRVQGKLTAGSQCGTDCGLERCWRGQTPTGMGAGVSGPTPGWDQGIFLSHHLQATLRGTILPLPPKDSKALHDPS